MRASDGTITDLPDHARLVRVYVNPVANTIVTLSDSIKVLSFDTCSLLYHLWRSPSAKTTMSCYRCTPEGDVPVDLDFDAYESKPQSACFNRFGDQLAVVHDDKQGKISIWCMKKGKLIATLFHKGVSAVEWQWKALVCVSSDGEVKIWKPRKFTFAQLLTLSQIITSKKTNAILAQTKAQDSDFDNHDLAKGFE